ncbi:major capsid protein [Microbacterium sp. GXS0129]|uniref:major capsid protein n=1 Tax=Microbacterium sp. GXS0129 TaxID=3377836 RepID=UPI00383A3BB1
MANLFSYGDVKNHPSRSGFDLSKKLAFTAKAGELLPVYWRMTYPGDKFNLNVQHFTRTQPVETAAFTRVREYFDWYFVPLRLISKNFPQAIVNMDSNPVQATRVNASKEIVQDIPWTNLVAYGDTGYCASLTELISLMSTYTGDYKRPLNAFGFYESACTAKLTCYLGYGNFLGLGLVDADGQVGLTSANMSDFYLEPADDVAVNLLPFFAYQKIYADFFRFGQWEKNEPYTYNVDYYLGGNFLSQIPNSIAAYHSQGFSSINLFCTLRYANWNKDMFMGMLPEQQLGDIATVTTSGFTGSSPLIDTTSGKPVTVGNALPTTGDTTSFGITSSNMKSGDALGTLFYSDFSSISGSFDILSLRLAEATQRWREISQCADPTYREQIRAHFGVNLSAALSDKCMYVGGSANNIDISEVVNADLNASATETPGATPAGAAIIKGKGVGTGSGSDSFTADEHGILMCIYHAVPLLDYVITGQRKELLYTTFNDLPVPEFDRIGMESLPLNVFMNGYDSKVDSQWIPNDLSVTMGYVPRFVELKTDVDEIQGAFRSTLKSWVAPLNPSYLASWFGSQQGDSNAFETNYNFFKVNPSLLDSVFGVKCDSTWDTDQFLINCMFNISAVRNFDYDGMPY